MSFNHWLKNVVTSTAHRFGVDIVPRRFVWRGENVTTLVRSLSEEDLQIAFAVEPYTATSLLRVAGLIQATRYLSRYQIQGDIVECGVWRGGSSMAIARTLVSLGDTSRDLYLFDTYDGMTEPSVADTDRDGRSAFKEWHSKTQQEGKWCYASLDEVRENLRTTGYPERKIHLIKGKVEETIPCQALSAIALLRLDTDWHESTKHELMHLFPILVKHGVLIVDDYGHWQGARVAVDQFLKERPNSPLLLNSLDYTGRLAVKACD